jgi:hypothetical protein
MPVELASHPQYGAEAAKYRNAKEAATQAADDVALARANEEWANTQARLTADLYERQDKERSQQARLAQIKAENPNVPDNVLEGITDLDQAERIAKSFQEVAAGRPQQGGGTWSPPPGGGSQGATEPSWENIADPQERANAKEAARVKRMDEIAPDVMKRGALEREKNEELQRLSLAPLTERFQPR